MRDYVLTSPRDKDGQPIRIFRANLENNVSKAIDQLSGICAGILADGEVNVREAAYFADWVQKYAAYEPVWPFTDILARVERIFADGCCDDDEREELRGLMQAICGQQTASEPAEVFSSSLPLDAPSPSQISFPGHNFCITGRFAFGTRRKVLDAIEKMGGAPSDAHPTRETHYMVIGTFASRDWYNTNYGRKIERAVELRKDGTGIAIVSEEHWRRFLSTGAL
jgi:hypothetical protein